MCNKIESHQLGAPNHGAEPGIPYIHIVLNLSGARRWKGKVCG